MSLTGIGVFIIIYRFLIITKYANNSEIMMYFLLFCLNLHSKLLRKYAKQSEVWIGLTGIIISNNS